MAEWRQKSFGCRSPCESPFAPAWLRRVSSFLWRTDFVRRVSEGHIPQQPTLGGKSKFLGMTRNSLGWVCISGGFGLGCGVSCVPADIRTFGSATWTSVVPIPGSWVGRRELCGGIDVPGAAHERSSPKASGGGRGKRRGGGKGLENPSPCWGIRISVWK